MLAFLKIKGFHDKYKGKLKHSVFSQLKLFKINFEYGKKIQEFETLNASVMRDKTELRESISSMKNSQ